MRINRQVSVRLSTPEGRLNFGENPIPKASNKTRI